ncbi:MAG: hypothetical protein LBJ13_02430 [Puniceicoccales bacterium]|jgi:hypothetical protein|nr:hypothetical protein [Puniceicoccales bacterium]
MKNVESLTDYLLQGKHIEGKVHVKDYLDEGIFSEDRIGRLSAADAANQTETLMAYRVNHLANMAGAAMCYAPVEAKDEQYVMPQLDINEITSIGVAMAMLILSAMQNEIMLDTQMEAVKGTQNQKLSASNDTILKIKQQIRKSRYKSPFQKFMEWLSGTWVMKFLNSNYGKIIMFLVGAAVTIASFGSAGPAVIAISCALMAFQAAELILGKSMGELLTSSMDDGAAKMALQMSIDMAFMVANVVAGAAAGAGKASEQAVEKAVEKAAKKVAEETAKAVAEEAAKAAAKEVAKEVGEEVVKETVKEVTKEVAEEVAKEVSKEVVKETVKEATKEVAEKVSKEVASEVVEELGEEVIENLSKEAIEAAAKKAGEEAGKAVAKEVTEQLTEELGEELAKEIGTEIGQEVARNTAKEVAQNLGQEMGEEAAKEIGENAGKEAAQAVGEEIGENATKAAPSSGAKLKDALISGGRFIAGIKGMEYMNFAQQMIVAVQKFQQRIQALMQVFQALYQLAASEEEARNVTYAATVDAIRTKSDAQQEFYQMLIDNQLADIQTLMSYTKASYERAAEAIREQGETNMMIARNLVI